ncbi:MAG: hypothetical protein JO256_14360 [Alphaproteobacteria bacterium]|nr:hypothetical protein [Alphaproteobacteria bacterium]
MTLVLGFAPFILFAVLSRLSPDLALWAAFATAFVITIRDFVESPSLRLLDVGNLALFGVLALVRGFLAPGLSLVIVRALAELFLFLLLASSLLRAKPFSLEYAHAAGEERAKPHFLRVNRVISGIWAGAFAAMAAADLLLVFVATWPLWPAIAVSVAAITIAISFTLRYPAWAASHRH